MLQGCQEILGPRSLAAASKLAMADPHLAKRQKRATANEKVLSPEATPKPVSSNGDNASPAFARGVTPPNLFHRVKNQKSILALVIADSRIYAGTQGGEILACSPHPRRIVYSANAKYQIWSLNTYELLSVIPAHSGSVLSLFISPDKKLLFSSAGDAIVNVHDYLPRST